MTRRRDMEDVMASSLRTAAAAWDPPRPIWLCQAPSCGKPLGPDYVMVVWDAAIRRFCDTRCISVGSDDTQKARAIADHLRRHARRPGGLDS